MNMMTKKNKIWFSVFAILIIIFIEGVRLRFMIEAVGVTKKIKAQKIKNTRLRKEISKEKLQLVEKEDLDTIRRRAKEELGMIPSKTINYVKYEGSVSKTKKER